MPDSQRPEEQANVSGSDILSYASPDLSNRLDPRAIAAICFALLPIVLLPVCCSAVGPGANGMLFLCLVSPPIAVILGIKARGRPGSILTPSHRLARTARIIGYIELSLIVLSFFLLPNLGSARPRANRVKCASNLRQIRQGLMLYASDNRGIYPPTLDLLIAPDYLSAEVFVCPSSNDEPATGPTTQAVLAEFVKKGHCSYIYLVGGQPISAFSADHVLAHDNPMNHGESSKMDGINVLFGDGHVEWVTGETAQHYISELKAGHNPPRLPVTQPQTVPSNTLKP